MATNPIPISAKELKNKNPKSLPQKADEFSNVGFWSYTSLHSLDKILESGFFFASNLNNMNDKNESERHDKYKETVHALCFCTTTSEKIPMWYLYGGLTGEGCALGFTPGTMLSWIRKINKVYPVIDDENGKPGADTQNPLYVGKDVFLDIGWIFYQRTENPSSIKYKGTNYTIEPYWKGKFEDNNFFIKDYPWEYEREFRILLKNKSRKKYDRLAIEIPEELYSRLKLRFGPELSSKDLKYRAYGFDSVYSLSKEKMEKSKLGIQMDLLKRNEYHIKQYAKEHSDTICKAIKEAHGCKSQEDEPLPCK